MNRCFSPQTPEKILLQTHFGGVSLQHKLYKKSRHLSTGSDSWGAARALPQASGQTISRRSVLRDISSRILKAAKCYVTASWLPADGPQEGTHLPPHLWGHAQARAALGQAGAPPELARYGDVFKQVMLLSGSSLKSINIHNKHKAGISCSKNVVPSSLATSMYAAGIWGF